MMRPVRSCLFVAATCVFLSFAAGPVFAASDAASPPLVRLERDAFDRAAAADVNLPTRALDYGSFVWLEADEALLQQLDAAGLGYEIQQRPFDLALGGYLFDPAQAGPSFPEGWGRVGGAGDDLHLIQFQGPTKAEWLTDLELQGYQVVQYIHPNTYVVWGSGANKAAVEAVPSVRWADEFVPAYRVQPQWRALDASPQPLKVLLYRGANLDAVTQQLAALGGQVDARLVLNDRFEHMRVTLPGAAVAEAAKIPGVYSIQTVPTDGGLRGEMSNQVNVNNVAVNNQAFPGYFAWLTSVNLDGNGVIIANVDGGILHTHPNLVNRMVSCTGQTCGGSTSDSHGTHTAGIMAADGSSGVLDSFGFLRGQGVAPGANLVEQVYSPWFQNAGGMLLLIRDSYANGALLSGNSWGPAGSPRGYDDDTMQVDIGVRDASTVLPGNQSFTYVLSFMNGNGGTSSQGTPDEAKNIFNVGSTKMQASGGAQILDINDLSSNTAHGPALDGRTIPHIVAPGCSVDSTDLGNNYSLKCGTSMASPHVSGAVALFIEYYRNLPDYVTDPSPALVKAAFLPVARDLAGFDDADGGTLGHPFDSKQGWGRMDLESVVDPQVSVVYYDNPALLTNTGEEWTVVVTPLDGNQPMRLMLVWTDAPGHGLGGSTPAWNNDLDLIVEADNSTYRGNVFANGWSVPGGSADFRNNTEGVFLGPLPPAVATVRVRASNLTSDGVPATGDTTDQDFALVCYNCAQEPGFRLSAAPAGQSICTPDEAFYNINVDEILGFSEQVTLSASGLPAGATALFSANPVTPPALSVLTISNTGGALPGDYDITVTGTAPSLTRDTSVALSVFTSIPADPSLLAPGDGAVGTSVRPAYSWSAVGQASTYRIEVSDDPGFGSLVEGVSGLTSPSHQGSTQLTVNTVYYWRVRAENICGTGAWSPTFSFTTRETLPLLLVDDDDNSPNVRATYESALVALGEVYDVWDTVNTDNEPSLQDLAEYGAVIWFSGDEFGGAAGPGSAGETALADYLDAGGCLFISAQDYYYDRGLTSLMTGYLGVASATSDLGQLNVTGQGTVYTGFGPYSLAYPFTNYSDRIVPRQGAETAFNGESGSAAVSNDGGLYRTTYWGFPWEAIPSAADREATMLAFLEWCNGPRFADCNQNGIPDADDIALGTSPDCNGNAVPDACDVDDGTSMDANGNDVPDECEARQPLAAAVYPDAGLKNRYISFKPDPAAAGYPHGYRVRHASSGQTWYISGSYPGFGSEAMCNLVSDGSVPMHDFAASTVVHVSGCMIMPGETYEVRATVDGVSFSAPLSVSTAAVPGGGRWWADVVGPYSSAGDPGANPPVPPDSWTPPDGLMNGFDISAILQAFQTSSTAPHLTWVDINPEVPDGLVNGADVLQAVNAFSTGSGFEYYPFKVPDAPGPQGQGPCPAPPTEAQLGL